ncbi:MAG: hypothetical protein IKG22_09360 [Atopobiaceae bacterium]|nr:hypothetical protein [Atopobiaceae bacterium]
MEHPPRGCIVYLKDEIALCVTQMQVDGIRDAVFEKIEDQEDLAALRSAIAEDDGTRYSHEQVLAELGL